MRLHYVKDRIREGCVYHCLGGCVFICGFIVKVIIEVVGCCKYLGVVNYVGDGGWGLV